MRQNVDDARTPSAFPATEKNVAFVDFSRCGASFRTKRAPENEKAQKGEERESSDVRGSDRADRAGGAGPIRGERPRNRDTRARSIALGHVPILHRRARVEELRLGVHRHALGREAVDLDDGRVADRLEDVVVQARLGGHSDRAARGRRATRADLAAAEGDLLRGERGVGEREHVLPCETE